MITTVCLVRPQVPTAIAHLTRNTREPFQITTMSFKIVHTSEESLRFLVLGTNCGFACCLAEKNFIDDEPTFSLIRSEELLESLENSRPGIDNKRKTASSKREHLHVLQSVYIGESRLAVSYTDGSLFIWDLDRAITIQKIDTNSTGIVLNSMLK
jgi:WD40 repeat protein